MKDADGGALCIALALMLNRNVRTQGNSFELGLVLRKLHVVCLLLGVDASTL